VSIRTLAPEEIRVMGTWTGSWKDLSIWLVAILVFGSSACGGGENQVVEALDVEEVLSYWSVQGKRGDNFHLHPVLRFQIRNNGDSEADYIQTMAVFRLEGSPDKAWGNAYEYSISGDPVQPGELSRVVTLRCDSTFYSKDQPRTMLENEHWEQVIAEIFLRVGSSKWQSVEKIEVERRLGAPGVEKFLEPQDEEPPEKK
jgi:hypothetical protein